MQLQLRTSAFLALVLPLNLAASPSQGTTSPISGLTSISGPTASRYLAGVESRVFVDTQESGAIWALGDTYKAGFDVEGATYVPFLGSASPQNFPVHFRVASIEVGGRSIPFDASVLPVRDGQRVTFDRGNVLEVYDLELAGMEQSFVLQRPSATGDLVVTLAVTTDLPRGVSEDRIEFLGEHGGVTYGEAFTVDARNVRAAAATRRTQDGGIEIRVPSERLASAAWPLTIDPFIGTTSVDSSPVWSDDHPDVAYDATTDRYLIVYERFFSSTDHDVYSLLASSNGGVIAYEFVDVSDQNWQFPRVANLAVADQFLVVAQTNPVGTGFRTIRGRTREATGTGAPGTTFDISSAAPGVFLTPDVGGDALGFGTNHYCVVWKREISSTSSEIHARLARSNGTAVGSDPFLVSLSPTVSLGGPSISSSTGFAGIDNRHWNVVWTRETSALNHDVWGARIQSDGTISIGPFGIETAAANAQSPAVSPTSLGADFHLVTYSVSNFDGTKHVHGKLLSGTTVFDSENLTSLSFTPSIESQSSPSVDTDGTLFMVSCTQTVGGSSVDEDIHVSTFSTVGNSIVFTERDKVSLQTAPENQSEIVATGATGGPKRRAAVAFHTQTTMFNGDIQLSRYDALPFTVMCAPGVEGVLACPCGNFPSGPGRGCDNSTGTGGGKLLASGSVAPDTVLLGASDLRPNALCIFLQGNALSSGGVAFGDGVRCASGTLKRLYVKSIGGAGSIAAPSGGDLSITARSAAVGDPISIGQKRWYFVYYRDPLAFGCAFPNTFNASAGLQIDW
jgi:hypothetical protein